MAIINLKDAVNASGASAYSASDTETLFAEDWDMIRETLGSAGSSINILSLYVNGSEVIDSELNGSFSGSVVAGSFFGYGGALTGIVSDHALLTNLDFASSGHTGFMPQGQLPTGSLPDTINIIGSVIATVGSFGVIYGEIQDTTFSNLYLSGSLEVLGSVIGAIGSFTDTVYAGSFIGYGGALTGIVSDHGSLTGLSDDDHAQYLLASDATDRSTFAMNWMDLTDSSATTLHTHDHGGMDGLFDDDHTQYLALGPATTDRNTITPTADIVPLTLKASAAQTANLFDVVANDGITYLYRQNKDGYVSFGNVLPPQAGILMMFAPAVDHQPIFIRHPTSATAYSFIIQDSEGGTNTNRVVFDTMVPNDAGVEPYIFDTAYSLTHPTARLFSWKNHGVDKAYFLQSGELRITKSLYNIDGTVLDLRGAGGVKLFASAALGEQDGGTQNALQAEFNFTQNFDKISPCNFNTLNVQTTANQTYPGGGGDFTLINGNVDVTALNGTNQWLMTLRKDGTAKFSVDLDGDVTANSLSCNGSVIGVVGSFSEIYGEIQDTTFSNITVSGSLVSTGSVVGSYATFADKIGIGTTTPTVRVHVSGAAAETLRLDGGVSYGGGLTFYNSVTGVDRRNWGFFSETYAAGDLALRVSTAAGGAAAGNAVMEFLKDGKVGIGTTTPSQLLTVSGTILGSTLQSLGSVTGAIGYFTADAATTIPLTVKGAASQSANLQEWRNSAGTVLANVQPAGKLDVGGANGVKMGAANDEALNVTAYVSSVDNHANVATGTFTFSDGRGTGTPSAIGLQILSTSSHFGTATGGTNTGLYANVRQNSAQPLANLYGMNFYAPYATGAGTVSNGVGINVQSFVGAAAAVTTLKGINIVTPSVNTDGSVTNDYGIYIGNQNQGKTLNYAVYSEGGTMFFNSGAATVVPLVLKGAASQTANLLEWQNSTGGSLAIIRPDGQYENIINGSGIILRSPAGSGFRINVDNTGSLISTAL